MEPRTDRAIEPARAVPFVLAGCALYGVVYLAVYLASWDGVPLHLWGDFFMLWTGGRFVLAGRGAEIWRWDTFHAFQEQLLGHPNGEYPVPYPPTFLPVLALIGLLPYLPAFAAWMATTFALSCAALGGRGRLVAWLVAPASLVNFVIGHNGFLSAALAVGGMRLAPERPWAAGVLLGALSYKPQLFVLVPVALVAARAWRTLLSTALTAAALAAAPALWFGIDAWGEWVAFLPEFSRKVDADLSHLSTMMVSLSAGLRAAGLPRAATAAIQLAVAGLAVLAVAAAFRGGVRPVATATLLTATFLFTPYAYAYDLTLLAAAILLVATPDRLARIGTGEAAVLFLGWVLPVVALGAAGTPIGPVVLGALLAVLVRWAVADAPAQAPTAVGAAARG